MEVYSFRAPDTGPARLLHLTDSSLSATCDFISRSDERDDCTSCSSVHLVNKLDNLCIDQSALPRDKMDWDPASKPPDSNLVEIPVDINSLPEAINCGNIPSTGASKQEKPFHRWVRSLRKRAALRHMAIPDYEPRIYGALPPIQYRSKLDLRQSSHYKSSSGSSFGFVSAVKSAGVSLSSFGAVTRPRVSLSCDVSGAGGSARASLSGNCTSEDNSAVDSNNPRAIALVERSLRRRRILEELIKTEESYIGDIRFLANMYVTIFAAHSSIRSGLRSATNEILAKILQLHEDILGELHRVVPHSEYTQMDYKFAQNPTLKRGTSNHAPHSRWTYADMPGSNAVLSTVKDVPGMICEPQVAAEVARMFLRKMPGFLIYKEYGARYETVIEDIASTKHTILDWKTYQKGLEILAATLGSSMTGSEACGKSLTVADLLIKPIQRMCRYPLLFKELLNCTTELDCPNSHMEIDAALTRLKEATSDINDAKDNQQVKATLERTWLLQDRLVFSNQNLDAMSRERIRTFGHIQLCGALHICWPTADGVNGQYMICLLYANVLCLAYASKTDLIYSIQACIDLNTTRVENAGSGRGLQCSASFCWKLIFECGYQLYEIIMTACTEREEMEWRTKLSHHEQSDSEYSKPATFSMVQLSAQATGSALGESAGRIAPRITVQRAATIGSKAPSSQVVIKNTCATKHDNASTSARTSVNRSHSVLSTRIPVLAPSRSDRTRLEALLSDVWTREALPFPGMPSRSRSDYLVRTSASTVMRKLSVASIASSLSKRSGSIKQKHKTLYNMERDKASRESRDRDDGDAVMATSDETASEDENISRTKRKKTDTTDSALSTHTHPTAVVVTNAPPLAVTASAAMGECGWVPRYWPYANTNLRLSHSVKYKQQLRSSDPDGEEGRKLMRMRARSLRSDANETRREASGHSLRGMFSEFVKALLGGFALLGA